MQNEKEMKEKTISHFLYMISLISICNEIIILIVVIIIFLPFADSIIIKSLLGSYKVANLHLTIPILLNFRFLFLDKRKRQLKIYEKFYGGIPMFIYGIIMFILCLAKVFTSYDKDNGDGKIPYPFFDLYHQSWYISFFIILLIFIFGFGIGFLFDFLNKKLEKLIFPYDSSSEDDEHDEKILLINLIDMKETFKDIKYPESEQYSLRHVNMKFKVGERLAVVGMNGSGKTTFIKLLCRLYDPTEGEILLNGINIKKYRYDEYMDIFSVVFQDFNLFSRPLDENVAGSMNPDEERVASCLKDAGFELDETKMTKGLKTWLYKNIDKEGVEISGGEAQKIAIARALYKDAPFIILDEPTAALDPIAEAEIYEKFNDIVGDKTAVYISHRLSSCKFCDEIAVFHEGTVIQKGTHEELLQDTAGKYYELWNAQAKYYNEKRDCA